MRSAGLIAATLLLVLVGLVILASEIAKAVL